MKKNLFTIVSGIALMSLVLAFGSCKSGASATGSKVVDIVTPCSDDDFHTDKNYFRATGIGTSADLSTSKRKAKLDANANLAQSVNQTIKNVSDRYTNERQFNDQSEFEEKFEQLTRNVVNQELNNVATVCTKTQMIDGRYTSYVAVEVAKDELLNNISNQLSKDKKLQMDYDKMKYEDIFNEEMKKMEDSRP